MAKKFNRNNADWRNKFAGYIVKDKINFISGTMCPAMSDDNLIESPIEALKYYERNDVDTVIIQKKHMGSRCQYYWKKNDTEMPLLTSRKGGKIFLEEGDLKRIKSDMDNFVLKNIIGDDQDTEQVILDCELMPWSVMGKGLIDYEFNRYIQAVKSDFTYLREHGFYDMVKALPVSGGKYDEDVVSNNIKLFERQMRIHGDIGQPYLKPFGILKKESKTASSIYRSNYLIGLDQQEQVVLQSSEHLRALDVFHEFTKNGGEGIVVKPYFKFNENFDEEMIYAPYLKVRSEEYLRIIYGYMFKDSSRYEKIKRTRKLSKKLGQSIKEMQIGLHMLSHMRDSITPDNEKFISLVEKIIGEIEYDDAFLDKTL